MKYIIYCLLAFLFATNVQASPVDTAFLKALHEGVKVIKAPNKGRLDDDITLANPNRVYVTRYLRPKSREVDNKVTLTTATKRVVEQTTHFDNYIGKMKDEDFPILVEVRYKDVDNDWVEFAVELLYPGYGYNVQILREK